MGVLEEKREVDRFVEHETDLEGYRGYEWFQISDEEMMIFRLSLDQMPRLVAVYELYEAATGLRSDVISDEQVESLRSECPWLPQRETSTSDFQRFAKLFGVSYRAAHAFFTRQGFWAVRFGLSVYADEQAGP